MKQGGGKQKGSSFERDVCKRLSLWLTNGKREDCLWRSAMSGGRATVHGTKVRQAGDICAVAPEGHILCEAYFIECKHVKKLALDQAIIKNTGPLIDYWKIARREAKRHSKMPVIIAKQNGWPVLLVHYHDFGLVPIFSNTHFCLNYFDDLLALKPKKALA